MAHERRYGFFVAPSRERVFMVFVSPGYAREGQCIVDPCKVARLVQDGSLRIELTFEYGFLEGCKFLGIFSPFVCFMFGNKCQPMRSI